MTLLISCWSKPEDLIPFFHIWSVLTEARRTNVAQHGQKLPEGLEREMLLHNAANSNRLLSLSPKPSTFAPLCKKNVTTNLTVLIICIKSQIRDSFALRIANWLAQAQRHRIQLDQCIAQCTNRPNLKARELQVATLESFQRSQVRAQERLAELDVKAHLCKACGEEGHILSIPHKVDLWKPTAIPNWFTRLA